MNEKKKEVNRKLSATEIKRNLYNALTLCSELRRQCEEGLSSVSKESISSLIASCDSLKDQLDSSMEFMNTPSKRTDVLNKLLRTERKRRWRLKRRRLGRVKRTFFRNMLVQRNLQLDMWRKEREKQMEEEQEEERKREAIFEKETRIQYLLKQRTELQKLLLSVDALRRIRIQKLKNQGYSEESGRDPIEEGLLETCRKEVEGYKEVIVSKKKSEWKYISEEKEESDHDYYFGAETDINKLISIRRAWDAYLVPRGRGSRIPTHFVEPPKRPWI